MSILVARINPQKSVPFVIDGVCPDPDVTFTTENHNEVYLSDVRLILLHLVHNYATNSNRSKLYPSKRAERSIIDQMLFFVDAKLYPAVKDFIFPIMPIFIIF